ncbi:uncharacterized protein L3040_003859 [Drepanopeziza brunnea f. sp. 'multigermtubi']|uniref:Nudix hydrolase domain-containing protein n=1 Tax=Marssonina brunnea f. sp. multigermtubi (strain MB_m1) TaxID=1072389 RepID=K1WC11_MARBU|nr:uncharacterized protein MBM_07136 [Drepanopeziza brunnea f. sp. 'multigermtubi' MB_m1]EKD14925.1 hypothetical protein MBM_07136 [Drepanopeziza brunnea f. sp. 'multigermtubi' MB_m1]KAJ5046621.1 hypothetical protein L3040_003859 [Drepanopeziza brunnea f. sp. 'multigermtubi']
MGNSASKRLFSSPSSSTQSFCSAPPLPSASIHSASSSNSSIPSEITYDSSLEEFADPTFQDSIAGPECIHVGAVILSSDNKLLLVQPADTHFAKAKSPYRWDVPGAATKVTDETALHGLVRIVWELTGLKVTRIMPPIGEPRRVNTCPVYPSATVSRYDFEVQVSDEHQGAVGLRSENQRLKYRWVTRAECTHRYFMDISWGGQCLVSEDPKFRWYLMNWWGMRRAASKSQHDEAKSGRTGIGFGPVPLPGPGDATPGCFKRLMGLLEK